MAESISILVARCLTLYKTLVDPPDGIHMGIADSAVMLQMIDEQSRFKVWSGNIGAHRIDMSSLEYRLRDASHLKSQVINLLKDLTGLIEGASAIATGQKTPWDQQYPDAEESADTDSYDGFPDTELGQIALDVADVVNCLLRLTVAIRNLAPHERYVKTKVVETSHFEPFDIKHVRSKFDQIDPWLAERLGKAISRRRQYLKYRQSHHGKLAYGLDQQDFGADDAPDAETTASSIPSHLKDGVGSSTQIQAPLTVLRDDGSDAGVSQTSYATSVARSDELTIPPLPKEAQSDPFQCCLWYIIIEVKDRAAWKKHVYGDLQPCRDPLFLTSWQRAISSNALLVFERNTKASTTYQSSSDQTDSSVLDVCLERDCVTPGLEYTRRHEWIEHVRQNHWKAYHCITCKAILSSFTECKTHLEGLHPAERSDAELDALAKLSEQPLDIEKGTPCPLCDEILKSVQQYQRHVGRHQEQLSLFALPSFDAESEPEEENTDDEEDSDENKADDPTLGLEVPSLELKHFKCSHPGCERTFRRQADLNRHYKVVHTDEDKPKYVCDYGTCPRHNAPFFRLDHFRDHLREYHKEDLVRRVKKHDSEWWASRAINPAWWRCSRCLIRIKTAEHGFVCYDCGTTCEQERRAHRME